VSYDPGLMMFHDRQHLRTLSIFHYVLSGITFFFGCIPIIHIVLGILVLKGLFPPAKEEPEFPAVFGLMFVVFGSLGVLLCWTQAVLLIVAGRFLARTRHWLFCLVIASLTCIQIPLGTVLGIFTIVVLSRDSVRALFDGTREPPATAEPLRTTPPPVPGEPQG